MRDMIDVASGFQYSVNIGYDLGSDDKLKNFIPTRSALSLLEEILLSVNPASTNRARMLIGAYGKGKSHIVLTILAILMKRDIGLFEKLLPRLQENQRLWQLVQNYYESDDRILPVVISGSNTSLTQAFLLSLQRTLSDYDLLGAMPDTNYQAAVETIRRWEHDFPETFARFSDEIHEPIDTYVERLESYDVTAYEAFEAAYPKLTMILLLHGDIARERKQNIRRLLVYFDGIDSLDLHITDWHIQFNRQNETYRMLISICYLVVKGLLQTNDDGTAKLMDFFDEQHVYRLYEKFILEYYRKEHPEITASAAQISWQLDDGFDEMLPVLQTDIMLSHREKVLIIDAKYYAQTTQKRFDARTVHSGNLNQIFTYVKNKEAELSGKPHVVSGMLLYAKTDEEIVPNHEYRMSGNRIAVRTLDLSGDFDSIRSQLNGIISQYFGVKILENAESP